MNFIKQVLLLLFCLFGMTVTNAAAYEPEPHEVVRGDRLEVLAKKHKTTVDFLVRTNPQIKHPDHIEVGWKIDLPKIRKEAERSETASVVRIKAAMVAEVAIAEKVSANEFMWKKPGAEKCVDCDMEKFVRDNYPRDIAIALIIRVQMGHFITRDIAAGEKFDVMLFGHQKTRRNVVTAWKAGRTEPARVYAVKSEDGTRRYLLYLPDVCGNWAKKVEEVPLEPLPPPVPISQVPPPSPQPPPPPDPPPPIIECKTCPPLRPAYIFPALPKGTPIENQEAKRFYSNGKNDQIDSPPSHVVLTGNGQALQSLSGPVRSGY